MNVKSKEESEMTPEVVIGPGTQLRRARERKGLDQAKMAAQLHLSQAMIAALEVDDFDNLPGPVFVQGYLRKYARLLGVNEDAVVEAYQNMFPAADEPPIKRAAKQELGRELHSGYGMMRYVTWGILFSLVALVAFWWLTRVDLEEPIPIQSQEQAEMGVEESPVDRFVPQSLPVEQDVVQTNASSQPVVEESEQALGEIEAAPSSTDQLLPPQGESPAPSAADVQPVQPATPPREVAPTRESEPAQESEPQVAAGTESKRVLFVFSEPCWTEVRDQNGKLRIFGEIGSGRERVLDSRLGPFSILLGNAAGVRLSIGGELFDLKPFTRGKVARFTLDPDRL